MTILRSEAPDPERFVRQQLAEHVGRDVENMDEETKITGTVMGKILEALEVRIETGKEDNISNIHFSSGYTLKQCISFAEDRIKSQCPTKPSTEPSTE